MYKLLKKINMSFLKKKVDGISLYNFICIRQLNLSERIKNVCDSAEIKYLGDLLQYDLSQLLKFRNFGETSLEEMKEVLNNLGRFILKEKVCEKIWSEKSPREIEDISFKYFPFYLTLEESFYLLEQNKEADISCANKNLFIPLDSLPLQEYYKTTLRGMIDEKYGVCDKYSPRYKILNVPELFLIDVIYIPYRNLKKRRLEKAEWFAEFEKMLLEKTGLCFRYCWFDREMMREYPLIEISKRYFADEESIQKVFS